MKKKGKKSAKTKTPSRSTKSSARGRKKGAAKKSSAAGRKVTRATTTGAEKIAPTRGLRADGNRPTVHACIADCADNGNFSPNTPLRNIGAPAECVRLCILRRIGRDLLISDTDTENMIVAML